jgi:hypothetical protein
MPRESLRVGVVGVSRPPANRRAAPGVVPAALLADPPPLEAGMVMSEQGEVRTIYMGDHAVLLHSGETRNYIDNLAAARPSLWVATDGVTVRIVTADPYEGEALASDTGRVVEALAMPQAIVDRVRAFVGAHHVHEEFHKRKRTPATSAHDPRAPRVLTEDEKWVRSRGKAGLGPKGSR